jgi:hypothetical protein
MALPIATGVLFFVAVLIFLMTALVRRNHPDDDVLPASEPASEEDWLDRFSLETYKPMERLLSEADYEYLGRQPGYDPQIIHELRAEHRRIFRSYLHRLLRDFNELVYLAKLMAIQSNEDQPELMRAVFRIRVNFYWNVTITEIQLALAPLPLGAIDAKRLIGALGLVRDSLEQAALLRNHA